MGVAPTGTSKTPAAWIGLAVLAVGLATLAAATQLVPGSSPLAFGLLHPATRFELALPLIALGFAIAERRTRLVWLHSATFVLGVPLGGVIAIGIVAAISEGTFAIRHVFLFGPVICVLTGIALAVPKGFRDWLLPLAALGCGIVLGLVINYDDPTIEEHVFAVGAVVSGAWLVATPLLLRRRFERAWLSIAGRIFGSWLVAIGLMLGALPLVPRNVAPPPSPEAPAEAESPGEL